MESKIEENGFYDLSEDIKLALKSKDIHRLFPVQKQLLSIIKPSSSSYTRLRTSDLCVSASTGSGKTLAYLLPIIRSLSNSINSQPKFRALIVVPTRDLAIQIREVLTWLLVSSKLKFLVITGVGKLKTEKKVLVKQVQNCVSNSSKFNNKNSLSNLRSSKYNDDDDDVNTVNDIKSNVMADLDLIKWTKDKDNNININSIAEDFKLGIKRLHSEMNGEINDIPNQPKTNDILKKYIDNIDILVSTPGRLVDHIRYTDGFDLSKLEFLVLDEADKLLSQDYNDLLSVILSSINSKSNNDILIKDPLIKYPSRNVQKILLSATLNGDPRLISMLKLHDPLYLRVRSLNDNDRNVDSDAVTTDAGSRTIMGKLQDIVIADGSIESAEKYATNVTEDGNKMVDDANKEQDTDKNNDNDNNTLQNKESDISSMVKYVLPDTLNEYILICNNLEQIEKPLQLLLIILQFQLKGVLIFTKSVQATHRLAALLQTFISKFIEVYGNSSKKEFEFDEKKGKLELDEILKFDSSSKSKTIKLLISYAKSITIRSFSAELKQGERTKLLKDFRNNKITILVASDVVCRGVDLGQVVESVINYDIPSTLQAYVHRVGRTARAGNRGISISLLEPREMKWFKKEIIRNKEIYHPNLNNSNNDDENNNNKSSTILSKIKLPHVEDIELIFSDIYKDSIKSVASLL